MPREYRPRPENERHSKHVNIPLTPPQHDALISYADGQGMKKTDAARKAMLKGLETLG